MAFYTVLLGNSAREDVVVMKATSDPETDGSWSSVVFGGSRPVDSLWAHQEGTDIHIAFVEDNGRILYSVFDTTTDAWTIDREIVIGAPAAADVAPALSCSISVRSDGDVIILYNAESASIPIVRYARRESGTWTKDILVSDADSADWVGGVVVRGSSDRMHFFFKNETNDDAFQRTLTSTNVLETFPSAGDTSVVALDQHIFIPGISYDDGGTQRIRCPYRDSNSRISYAEFDSVDAPGAFTVNPNVSTLSVVVLNGSPVACMSSDGSNEHLLYSSQTIRDLWHDENGGTDTEIQNSVTANRISSNVYNRSGTKLAYVWLDSTTIKYDEVDISTPRGRFDYQPYLAR